MNKKQDCGIVINSELRIKTLITDDLPMYVRLVQIILIFLAVLSPVLLFVNALGFDVNTFVIVPVLIVVILLEYFAFNLIKNKDNSLMAMILILLFCIGIMSLSKKIMMGIFCFVEKYLIYFNMKFNTDYVLNTKTRDNSYENILLLVLVVAVFMSFIISYLVIVKMNKGLYILITIIWPILCYLVDIEPNYIFFVIYVIASIVILGIEQLVKNYEMEDQEKGFVKIQTTFKDIAYAKIELTVAIFALIMFLIFNIAFSKKNYEENNYIKNLSTSLRTGIENVFKKETKLFDAFGREVGSTGLDNMKDMLSSTPVLNNGAISEGGNARYYNKRIFRLVSTEVNDTLYLKHFVGLEYDNGWITETKDRDKLSKLSICDNMYGEVLDTNVDRLNDVLYYNMVGILTKELKNNLIPTGVNRHYGIGKNGIVKYKEENVSVVAGYEAELQKIYTGMEDIKLNYNNYDENTVKELYLDVPKKLRNTVDNIKPEIDDYIEKIKEKDKKEINNELDKQKLIIRALVNYMNYNFEYTLKPGKIPNNMDPIEYFLLENKKGYCMYYAAAATALLRSYGVPTRYVEGYVIRPKDCENAKRVKSEEYVKKLGTYNTTNYDFNNVPLYEYCIKDTNGHAWVEVFISKIGWVPVEVTPTSWGQDKEHVPERKEEEPNEEPKPTDKQNPREEKNNDDRNVNLGNNEKDEKDVKDKKDNKEKVTENNFLIEKWYIIIIIILLTVLGLYLCIKNPNSVSIVDKQKKLRMKDKFKYACMMSIYLLKQNNIDFGCNLSYKEFAMIINNRYSDYKLENIEHVIETILKSQFSNAKISKNEEKDVYDFYNFLVMRYEEGYKGITKIKRCSIDNYIRKI